MEDVDLEVSLTSEPTMEAVTPFIQPRSRPLQVNTETTIGYGFKLVQSVTALNLFLSVGQILEDRVTYSDIFNLISELFSRLVIISNVFFINIGQLNACIP